MFSRIPPIILLVGLALIVFLTSLWGEARAVPAATIYLPGLACGQNCTGPAPTPTTSPGGYSPIRLQAIQLINVERQRAGCPAATIDERLMRGAQDWSTYMQRTGDYRHAPSNWYPSYGYPYGGFENIGGDDSATGMVDGWMDSATHRRNLLWCYELTADPNGPDYRPGTTYDIGVGFANGYWTFSLGIHPPE